MTSSSKSSYHHGDLREALLRAALALVRQQGTGALSLREVARRAGVSHAAPAHHFGDKAGLLTALAAAGFDRFAAALHAGAQRGDSPEQRMAFAGWAYVMFAARQRPYFTVMFRPELLRRDDPQLTASSASAYRVLLDLARAAQAGTAVAPEALELQATSAWARAHGLATLWLDGNLPRHPTAADLDRLARRLFGLPPRT